MSKMDRGKTRKRTGSRKRHLGRARGFGAPLWQMEPSFDVVRRICAEARRATRKGGNKASQSYLRRVMAESDRRIAAAHIYVEGA